MSRLVPTHALVVALAASVMATPAFANDDLVVYIECEGKNGDTTQGSGVLVSSQGHVLTARHVVPDGFLCQASIGNSTLPKRGVRPSFQSNNINDRFDALLLEFGRNAGETFPFALLCQVTEALNGSRITAKGFHAGSFGPPSSSDGILSNTYISFNGLIETTAMTTEGKSGGPVFLHGTNAIVGIIAGAQFSNLGIVSSYSILATNAVQGSVDLLTEARDCGGQPEDAPQRSPSTREAPTQDLITDAPYPVCYVDDVRPPDDWLAMRSEPSTKRGRQILRLPSGTAMSMLSRGQDDWFLVRLSDGTEGWVSWRVSRWIRCLDTSTQDMNVPQKTR